MSSSPQTCNPSSESQVLDLSLRFPFFRHFGYTIYAVHNIPVLETMGNQEAKSFTILGHVITPKVVGEVIAKASAVNWGTHLLRWRYFDVTHAGVTYHRDALIPTALWHVLKRVHVDQDWPSGTTLEQLNEDARATIQDPNSEIYVYGYYRTDPPRLQWGFFNPITGIAVIYDMEADLVATVFRPVEGALFFVRQLSLVKIDREEWQI